MVVNGREHFVGSNAAKLNNNIQEYQRVKSRNEITITEFKKSDRNISFNYGIIGAIDNIIVRAVLVLDERTKAVKRGENCNRTLKNSNIVVLETYFDVVSDMGSGKIEIPTWIKTSEKMQLVLLLEKTDFDIITAAKVTL